MNNDNSAGDAVSCEAGNCPLVESADTTTLYEFNEYETNFKVKFTNSWLTQ